MNKKKYYRAVGVAEFIIEGHTIKQTTNEFRISSDTITKDLKYLVSCEYGNQKENIKLYVRAKKQLKQNSNNIIKYNNRSC